MLKKSGEIWYDAYYHGWPILECKEQGMQFASDNEGENNSDWIESVGQHSLLTMLVYLWYLWYALSATKKKTQKQKQIITDLNKKMKPNHFKIFKWILTPLFLENTYRCIKLKLMKRNYLYFLSIICSGYYCSVIF